MKPVRKIAKLLSPEDGLRAVTERAPQAEILALSSIERLRPFASQVYTLRRRIATIAVGVLAISLFVHVVFGAHGMGGYRQKRRESQELQRKIEQVQQENDRYMQQIQGLKTDQTAIEKEAREQLGYAKPGEYVYVPPAPAKPPVPGNRSTNK